MVLSALIVLSNASVGAGTLPLLWIAARMLYGFAICAMFIVAQSWLNDVVGNADPRPGHGDLLCQLYRRARASARYLLGFVDLATAEAPLIGIVFTALSILPVGMTRLRQPPAPEGASVALRRGLADFAGRHGRHAGGRRPVDDDRRLCADPCDRKRLSASRRWRRCCSPCRSARCSSRSRSAGSPTAPTAAMC